MKPTPFADIMELPDGADIYVCTGTIKFVNERKTGTNSTGEWSIQNLVLTQGGIEITAMLKDRPDEIPKTWKGRDIILEAYHGEKGWSGVKVFDDEYQGKVKRKIKVTPTGQVSLLDAGGGKQAAPGAGHQAPAGQAAPQKPAPTQQRPTQTQAQAPQEPAGQEDAAKQASRRKSEAVKAAIQIANLQLLALNLTETYTAPRFLKVAQRPLTEQEKHAFAMNMTIELMRGQKHLSMPDHMLKDPTPGANQPPTSGTQSLPLSGGEVPKTYGGKPWPKGAVPHPETGEPVNPDTGAAIY